MPEQSAPRHRGRAQAAFVDAHAEAWPYYEFRTNKKDLFAHNGW